MYLIKKNNKEMKHKNKNKVVVQFKIKVVITYLKNANHFFIVSQVKYFFSCTLITLTILMI
jgi:hypothetical protein